MLGSVRTRLHPQAPVGNRPSLVAVQDHGPLVCLGFLQDRVEFIIIKMGILGIYFWIRMHHLKQNLPSLHLSHTLGLNQKWNTRHLSKFFQTRSISI